MSEIDIAHLKQWIDKTEETADLLAPFPANALAATLDRDDPPFTAGSPLPPMWHLAYCLPTPRMSGLGPDGHAKRGGFLPPVPLPRRMWAGGRMTFPGALVVGSTVRRTARVLSVEQKIGRTGPLVFVTVRFEFHGTDGIAVTEERDLVYREASAPGAPAPAPKSAPADSTWQRIINPDPVLLFRYSAHIFNGHRIHYDRDYCLRQEGYPGLVVHGPLIATLLVDLVRREMPTARIESFTFRSVSPLFDTAPFAICGTPDPSGRTIRLWARNADGGLAMEASAAIR